MNIEQKPSSADATAQKLARLGKLLETTDHHLVHLMARRINLARKVAEAKHATGAAMSRPDIERKRLDQVSAWADGEGIDPNFARSLLYGIIGESCKQQSIYRESTPPGEVDRSPGKLRQNLLRLTAKYAPTYDLVWADPRSVRGIHANFEHRMLGRAISHLLDYQRGTIVEIGCATGRELFLHARDFKRLIGYDVCPHMIDRARERIRIQGLKKAECTVHDVEQGIPLEDGSVSCVIMNHGTASDIPSIVSLLRDVQRILQPGGVFLVSFYNSEAMMYQAFMPWPPALGAEIAQGQDYIEVSCGGEILPVYAKARSVDEVQELLPSHLIPLESCTHPTIGSIIPSDVFTHPEHLALLSEVDESVASGRNGAYAVFAGVKR